MVVPVIYAGYAVATTAGRIALPILAKEFAKRGGTQFIKTYGKTAFQAVTGGAAGAVAYDQTINKSVPVQTGLGDYIGDTGEKEKERERIAAETKEQMKGSTQPKIKEWQGSFPDQSGEIVDTSPPPSIPEVIEAPKESLPNESEKFNKPIIYNKDDTKKQTDKLVPEKVELGPLSAVDKQTAIALKGNKPDFYSRAVEAITNAKQDKSTKGKWRSIIQSNSTKEEMNYLGLTEFLKGNESVTKDELLKLVKDKNIAPDLVFTKIPKSDQLDFSTFSIGGAGNTTGQYVIQLSKDFDAESLSSSGIEIAEGVEFGLSKKIYQATGVHLKEAYGRNAVAHARTQIGFDPMEDEDFKNLAARDQVRKITNPVIKNATEKLSNTFIVDEIQSDWIQDIQKFGTKDKPKFTVLKGSEVTPEYIEDNYEDLYDLRISKFQTQKDLLENTGMSTNKVLYRIDKTTGDTHVEKRIENDLYYVFYYDGLTPESKSVAFQEKEQAMDHIKNYTVENLPIIQSKEYVKLMLDSLIKEAVTNGTDSIGITNGQIQGDRYVGQGEKEAEGLKKFYDKIVIPQLEKIAKEYGVTTESININEPELTEAEDIKSIPNRMKMAMQNGMVLKKIRGDVLYGTLNNAIIDIPDFFTIYSNSGRAQGSSRIMSIIENDEPNVIEVGAGEIDSPTQYFIWVRKGSALSETLSNRPNDMINLKDYFDKTSVDYTMPLTLATPDSTASEATSMTSYSDYILNYKSKGIDLGYEHDEHQIIKMPLPKKLQKKILSESIKLSKLKTQTDRLTA